MKTKTNEQTARTIRAYDTIAWSYDQREPNGIMLQQIGKFMEYCPRGKILDVGCGTGRDTEHFYKTKRYTIMGIDNSKQMLEVAREKLHHVSFKNIDMRHMQVDSGTFDGIWCCASFHHVAKIEAPHVLQQFHIALKSKGLLFITVKKGVKEEMVELEGGARFFAAYKMKELEGMVRDGNFEVVESYENHSSHGNVTWLNLFAKAIR